MKDTVTMSLNILNESVWGASGKIADDEELKASNICYISIILGNKQLPHRWNVFCPVVKILTRWTE